MNKNVFLAILFLIGFGLIIDSCLKIKALQKEVSHLRYSNSSSRNSSKIAELESRIMESIPGRQAKNCKFGNAKYSVQNMGYLNFEITNYNDVRCRGKLKGKKINEIVEVGRNTIRINNEFLKVELNFNGECNRIKGILTWQREDDTWLMDDMLLIKV